MMVWMRATMFACNHAKSAVFWLECTIYLIPRCVEQFEPNFQPAFLYLQEFHCMQVRSNVLGLIS